MSDTKDDDAVYADIGHGHGWEARQTGDDEISIRIHRPSGTGRPLYETLTLSFTEAEALLQLMMDIVG